MNPNRPDINDCPYDHPAEQARLRSLVDSMNVLIRHYQSLSGAESQEYFVKTLQKLLLKAGLPNELRNRLQPFYLSVQLKAAQQDEWFDAQVMDDAFRDVMECCSEPDARIQLKDLAERTRALIEQRFTAALPKAPKDQLKKDLLAVNNANPVHWRVRNFFRKKIREGISAKPLDFKTILKELKKDWETREGTAEAKAAERRQEADKTLSNIRADLRMGQHIREVLQAPAPEKTVDVARAAEQVLIQERAPLPGTKPQIDFPGDMVEADSKAAEEPAAPPEAEEAFPFLEGMPIEESDADESSVTPITRKQIQFPEHEAAKQPAKMKEAANAEEAFEWGNEASRKGDYELARQYFEQAITIDPNFILAYKHLGYVLEQLGELKLAADYHRTAAEMEAYSLIKSARQAVRMGDNFNHQNDFERALECYKKIFTQGFDPTPDVVVMAHFGMGQVFLKKNELESAKEHFKKILETDPNHFDSCYYLGYIFHRQENLEAAKTWYKKALQIRPDDERVKKYLSAIRKQETQRASSGSTLEDAFAALAVQQQKEESEFQATMGQNEIDVPEDIATGEPDGESEPYHTPDTGQLNGIGLPVEPDNLPPPPISPDSILKGEDAFDFLSPAVRGQSGKLTADEILEQNRIRAKKRLGELYQIIACEEHRASDELEEAVKGYVSLVKQPKLSCIEGVDHRGIAVALRRLWREGVMKDFLPVEMAHSQDLAISEKVSGKQSEEYFIALAEYGKSCFETRTLQGFRKAGVFFFQALEISPEPKGKYAWVHDLLEQAQKWIQEMGKGTKEQPVRIEEDFEESLRPPTIVSPDIPEAVRQEAQEGMGIFGSPTRKFVPGKTKVRPEEPKTIPKGEALEYRLKERMGDLADEPVTQRNIEIPEGVRPPEADEFDRMPPTMPNVASKEEATDGLRFRRKAQALRHQYMESEDPGHKIMLQKTIMKYHHDDITLHEKKSAESYLEFGISLIAFGEKSLAARSLNEALALAREGQQTLQDEIHKWLGKL